MLVLIQISCCKEKRRFHVVSPAAVFDKPLWLTLMVITTLLSRSVIFYIYIYFIYLYLSECRFIKAKIIILILPVEPKNTSPFKLYYKINIFNMKSKIPTAAGISGYYTKNNRTKILIIFTIIAILQYNYMRIRTVHGFALKAI